MDKKTYNIRVPKHWAHTAMIVAVTALIVAPLTAAAGHVFNDVPGSHTFHNDITWLADADVTKGCNPPANDQFCPDDDVTRGQMSAFMRRFAQYIGAEDGTPVRADNATNADNADTLDGKQASAFVESRWAFVNADGSLEQGQGVTGVELRSGFTNQYLVTFDRSVAECGYLATVSQSGGFATATDFFQSASGDVVNVVTRDPDGNDAQRAFTVQLVC